MCSNESNNEISHKTQAEFEESDNAHTASCGEEMRVFNFLCRLLQIISKDGVRCPPKPKPAEGQARAKYNFNAQSSIELSLNKGELVKLTRRVDDNWFEGRIANRKGIFPVAYVEVLTDIGTDDAHMTLAKPVGSPAAHSLITPPQEVSPYTRETRFELEAPVVGENGVIREMKSVKKTEVLHVDTNSDPIP